MKKIGSRRDNMQRVEWLEILADAKAVEKGAESFDVVYAPSAGLQAKVRKRVAALSPSDQQHIPGADKDSTLYVGSARPLEDFLPPPPPCTESEDCTCNCSKGRRSRTSRKNASLLAGWQVLCTASPPPQQADAEANLADQICVIA